MFNGTSMASPQATGAAALLLSAAKADRGRRVGARAAHGADQHRRPDRAACPRPPRARVSSTPQDAWKLLARGTAPRTYDVSAPVCSPLSHQLATPHQGTGVYNRCLPADGGQSPRTTTDLPRHGDPARRRQPVPGSTGSRGSATATARSRPREGLAAAREVAGTIRITARPRRGRRALGDPAGRRPGHQRHRPADPGHRGQRRRCPAQPARP